MGTRPDHLPSIRAMNVLVTAGNTKVLIDRVRCLTNIFTGRTGTAIALHAHERGHDVTLLTSRPEAVAEIGQANGGPAHRWAVRRYETFADLDNLMAVSLRETPPDALIHSAAVSDYLSEGIFAPAPGTRFDPATSRWHADDTPPALLDRAAAKVKSDDAELWLRLVRAPKLVDRVRTDWGFRGLLVKFKLEVGVAAEQLLEAAELSRRQSAAELMVANTWEEMNRYAYLGPLNGHYQRVDRDELPRRLFDALEQMTGDRADG
jgi:phosphopantothenoylcysteine synthetase/decarboxylase